MKHTYIKLMAILLLACSQSVIGGNNSGEAIGLGFLGGTMGGMLTSGLASGNRQRDPIIIQQPAPQPVYQSAPAPRDYYYEDTRSRRSSRNDLEQENEDLYEENRGLKKDLRKIQSDFDRAREELDELKLLVQQIRNQR